MNILDQYYQPLAEEVYAQYDQDSSQVDTLTQQGFDILTPIVFLKYKQLFSKYDHLRTRLDKMYAIL